MLVQLIISHFAIIDRLEIDFKPGLNILSGETGAGKSIIINALNLILGGRASTDLIRSGCNEARVEALFRLPLSPPLTEILTDFALPFDGELLIKRTISREGRNRIMMNGSAATLQMLSRVGPMLISISGQHEHQLLLKPDNHLYLLDEFGGLSDERLSLNESLGGYQTLLERSEQLSKGIQQSSDRQELARFQMNEIDAANINPGEDLLLEEERTRLLNAEQQRVILAECYQTLYEKEGSVLSDLAVCTKKIEKGAAVDRRLVPVGEALGTARVELEEAALELRDLRESIVVDPARLEEVEERIQQLNRLKRKYGLTLEDVLNFNKELSEMREDLVQKSEELDEINRAIEEMANTLTSRAAALSKKRKRAAKKFEQSVKEELKLLDMAGTRFQVCFYRDGALDEREPESRMAALKTDGFDRAEFMISPNVGEELKPLSRIASGGELSRIMLALKTIVARTASIETVIFDEIDSGIGGATAEVVGEKLQLLADYHQLMCITHLPQIASKGNTHFRVEKKIVERRTQTFISELDPEERVSEIARLLGGKAVSKQAIAHATEMLEGE